MYRSENSQDAFDGRYLHKASPIWLPLAPWRGMAYKPRKLCIPFFSLHLSPHEIINTSHSTSQTTSDDSSLYHSSTMESPEDSSDGERTGPTIEHPDDPGVEKRTGPYQGRQILDLMMPMFSGMKDDFGKELVPPLPLLFDRVSEGRKPVSGAKLLRIPLEVLALVVQKVPEASLASLALVNSDCRQLARSRQFSSLHFDYSDKTLAIIKKLLGEAVERLDHDGLTGKPALGPCIRRLTVATHPGWVTYRHDVELSESFNALPKKEQSKRLINAYDAFFGSYLTSIQHLLSNRTVLPHLELLDWEDMITLQPSFFDSITHSAIQHLKVYRIRVDKAFTINPPKSQPSRSWPLRSLYLEILPDMSNRDLDVSRLCTSILHVCAPSLQSLTWESCSPEDLHTDGLGPSPRFPSLRHLRLAYSSLVDVCSLQELVHDELNSLDVDTECSPACSEFFDRRGRVPALKIFVWSSFHLPESQSLAFLEANPQISKLSMPMAAPRTLLEDRILPLLAQSFSSLTSLSLVWSSLNIPCQAMEYISRITTLQQLHLSAGFQAGWRHDWLIDHQVMQRYLRNLPLLKKLAFSRDSYSNGFTPSCERYYVDGLRRLEDVLNENYTRETFEEEHRQWVLGVADGYVEEMSQLEWLYFGQIPMAVEQCPERKRKIAKALTTERDDCWTLLREMFGWKGLLPT